MELFQKFMDPKVSIESIRVQLPKGQVDGAVQADEEWSDDGDGFSDSAEEEETARQSEHFRKAEEVAYMNYAKDMQQQQVSDHKRLVLNEIKRKV